MNGSGVLLRIVGFLDESVSLPISTFASVSNDEPSLFLIGHGSFEIEDSVSSRELKFSLVVEVELLYKPMVA